MKLISESELLEKLIELDAKEKYEEGLNLINENEDIINKKYYEICRFKITFLIFLNKYMDASLLIKNELSVTYIPRDFEKFLITKQKEVNFLLKDKEAGKITSEDIENIDKVDNDTLLSLLPYLNDFNLNKFVEKFQVIFSNDSIKDLTKTLLIASLSDYKLDHSFEIIKEKQLVRFNPSKLFDIRESENYQYILDEIEKINDLEINSVEILKKLSFTYLLSIYPLVVSEENCDEIISAALTLLNVMFNKKVIVEKFSKLLITNEEKVTSICEKMNNLLEGL